MTNNYLLKSSSLLLVFSFSILLCFPKSAFTQVVNDSTVVEDSAIKRLKPIIVTDTIAIKRLQDSIRVLTATLNFNETRIKELSAKLEDKNRNLEEQIKIQREKETLFLEKEAIYKDAMNSTILDKVKLEGQLAAKDSRIEGKDREIILLQKNLTDKDKDIVSRDTQLQRIESDKELTARRLDTIRMALLDTEKSLIKTTEQLKYTELKIKDCEARYTSVTNKKKKTRVVQGFAIKNYRTPDFILAPKDINNPNLYVINNRNSSNIEFDYVTGASFMIKDLSKPGGVLTYDLGFFLGFGGNNLFKNFYIGPNMKLFDVIHLNIGANIAEFEVLKDGFNVGDALVAGTAIPTNKSWKINAYLGFTFDLELITMIGKK